MINWLNRKRLFALLGLLILLVALPLTPYLVRQRQIVQKRAIVSLPPTEKEIDEIYPLEINKPVYRLSIGGSISLNEETSFIRIILIDSEENEYLVYEAYPLIVDETSFSIDDACEETCLLEAVTPVSLRIEGYSSSFKIDKVSDKVSFLDKPQELDSTMKVLGISSEGKGIKKEKDRLKIQKLNERIKAKGLKWIAGETPISRLSYAEKKKLFVKPDGTPVDRLPNLQGFEYYKGGIFEIKTENENSTSVKGATTNSSGPPEAWDWRNVHGENWNTPVRDQGAAGTCWAFANTAAIESLINLYFNQHLDVDLSEQMHVDCINNWDLPMGMNDTLYDECSGPNWVNLCYPGSDFCVIGIHGISDEACDPYAERDIWPAHCDLDHICSDWQDRVWKITDFHDYKFFSDRGTPQCPKQTMDPSEEEFKKVLIEKGPMGSLINVWNHAMVLIGYQGRTNWKTIQSCPLNEFCDPAINECIPIECNSPGEEKTICFNNKKYGNSLLITYKCELSPYTGFQKYEWVKEDQNPRLCPVNTKCTDNECRPQEEYILFEGKRECSLLGSRDFPREISVYKPQGGDNYWIFKNSWGIDWGEEGYARVEASLANLGYGSLPIGPIISPTDTSFWPADFTNQINCVDKDGDGYCNWGISEEKPVSCPASCQPEKDCDDSNPDLGPFDDHLNCTSLKVSPTPTPTPTPPPTPTPTPIPTSTPTPVPTEPTLFLEPKSGEVGETFEVEVMIHTGGKEITGADTILNYEPDKLEGQEIIVGEFSSYLFRQIDEGAGKIKISAIVSPGSSFTGTKKVATIRFRKLQDQGTTSLTFDFTPGSTRDCNLVEKGTVRDILQTVINGSYNL